MFDYEKYALRLRGYFERFLSAQVDRPDPEWKPALEVVNLWLLELRKEDHQNNDLAALESAAQNLDVSGTAALDVKLVVRQWLNRVRLGHVRG